MNTCKCGHPDLEHGPGGLLPCDTNLHPACGCGQYRPDVRRREEDAATGTEDVALWA